MREFNNAPRSGAWAAWLAVGALLAPAARAAEPNAYPRTQHRPAELALLLQPDGAQEPVSPAAAVAPQESDAEPSAEALPATPVDSPPLKTAEPPLAIDDPYLVDPLYNPYYDPAYDRVCAPQDPRQPLCRHTDDFMWGCGGSPFRTGPGTCDTWRVGPVWDTSVDGMVLWRGRINLDQFEQAALALDPTGPADVRTQFGYGAGGRIYAMGKLPRWPGYQLQFGYQGVEEWNAALLFPEFVVDQDDDITATRAVHYRSSFHSAEFNIYRRPTRPLRPYWGIRYVRFGDKIQDAIDETAPPPVPEPGELAEVTTIDDFHFVTLRNNLIGPQIGVRRDLWHVNRRLTMQGFVNGGVYYNRIQFAQGNATVTTTQIADDPSTPEDESATITTTSSSIRSTVPTEIAFLGEASLTAVCKINRCLALRGGYQLLWIDGLHLAENVYLNDAALAGAPWAPRALARHNFLLHGWHVGIEYRR